MARFFSAHHPPIKRPASWGVSGTPTLATRPCALVRCGVVVRDSGFIDVDSPSLTPLYEYD
ncbi:MAG: hypothetical protein GY899_12820 [Verrucomicrobiaceae bacterium]|nr:hypothetical protein [Verrucomicrobiaceae bacterium]